MSLLWKPSKLTKDKRTFYFLLICLPCGEWHVSLGDLNMHLSICESQQCNLLCGHCAQQWTDWHDFVNHINRRGMYAELPYDERFQWIHDGQETASQPPISFMVGDCKNTIPAQDQTDVL